MEDEIILRITNNNLDHELQQTIREYFEEKTQKLRLENKKQQLENRETQARINDIYMKRAERKKCRKIFLRSSLIFALIVCSIYLFANYATEIFGLLVISLFYSLFTYQFN